MTEERIDEVRQQIDLLNQEFSKKVNTAVDLALSNEQQLTSLEKKLDRITELTSSNAEAIASLREEHELFLFTVEQLHSSVTQYRQTQRLVFDRMRDRMRSFEQQANADRAVMLEILQYLRNQFSGNGKGGE